MNKRIFFSLVASAVFISQMSAEITQHKAKELANEVFSRQTSITRNGPDLSQLSLTTLNEEIYIINNLEGGWVLVGTDDRLPQPVLAYSFSGTFNYESMPGAARLLVDGLVKDLSEINTKGKCLLLPPTRTGESVEPLLGDIEWDQYYPYNALFPEIGGEFQAPAGCTNIAIGQIMRYYKYPLQGKGQFSYTWNGTEISADFSKSEYNWDLMLPTYSGVEYSEESKDAVAKLVYDCAVANSSYFGQATGAALMMSGLIEFFGYDKSIFRVHRPRCSLGYYESIMRNELDSSRPIYVTGGSQGGAHAFVCDGYDSDGYFHYNFGWGSGSNGYFLSSATGFDSFPFIVCSIMPECNGQLRIWAGCTKDFSWSKNNTLECDFEGWIDSELESSIEIGIAAKSEKSEQPQYFVEKKIPNAISFNMNSIDFNNSIDDGEYILYPVYRLSGGEWQKFCFADNMRDYVLLSVANGEKTYTNPIFLGDPDPGVETIDGYYYRFEDEEAILTRRNNRPDNYSGNVEIPSEVTFEGRTVPVVKIDTWAFQNATLDAVAIGANVRSIEFGAFSGTTVSDLTFSEPSKLEVIQPWAFSLENKTLENLILPEGLRRIGMYAFRADFKKLDIPESVVTLEDAAFSPYSLTDIYVHWQNSEAIPDDIGDPFNFGNFEKITLHVPQGTKEIYANNEIWNRFGNIIEDSKPSNVPVVNDNEYEVIKAGDAIKLVGLPNDIKAIIYNIDGVKVAEGANGDEIHLGKGIFIIHVGATTQKIIL